MRPSNRIFAAMYCKLNGHTYAWVWTPDRFGEALRELEDQQFNGGLNMPAEVFLSFGLSMHDAQQEYLAKLEGKS